MAHAGDRHSEHLIGGLQLHCGEQDRLFLAHVLIELRPHPLQQGSDAGRHAGLSGMDLLHPGASRPVPAARAGEPRGSERRCDRLTPAAPSAQVRRRARTELARLPPRRRRAVARNPSAHIALAADIDAEPAEDGRGAGQGGNNLAGYVRTQRGAGGGFALGRPASAITLGDVVRDLEDDQRLAECIRSDGGNCVLTPRCRLKKKSAAAREAFPDKARRHVTRRLHVSSDLIPGGPRRSLARS